MKKLLIIFALTLLSNSALGVPVSEVDTVYLCYSSTSTPSANGLKSVKIEKDTTQIGNTLYIRLPKLKLFLCIGQSNMAGRGVLDSQNQKIIENVYLFDGEGFERGKEPMNRYSTIRKDITMQGVGPVSQFARYYSKQMCVDVGVIVNARGGSSILEWLPHSEKGYIEEAVKRAKQAQKWGDIEGVLWHQGEADCRYPQNYESRLNEVVKYLRSELNNPNLPFIFGEIAHWNWTKREEGTTPFNDMLRKIKIPNTYCITAEGLEQLKDSSDPHFSAKGASELGLRYAKILLKITND